MEIKKIQHTEVQPASDDTQTEKPKDLSSDVIDDGSKENWFDNAMRPPDEIDVYFNPNEIEIDKQVSWPDHKHAGGDAPQLEFDEDRADLLKPKDPRDPD